ncbi:tail fiber protein [Rheinheimera sp. UJ51]|uniref:phage tail protein n=1 Tax=unclassified Rheinheimera TaxID=115860 RepID=UPI001E38EB99|nr:MULTISPECIES: tail fiber protein [unclassified Rheinheimera]MCC5452339.1 tail fiber protein [Rheinheimera sp. UJ51]MCF4008888.1 tail fiber protein [Rheinheimera sp. UJ63]
MKIQCIALAATLAVSASVVSTKANACGYEPMLGSMCVFAGNFAPRGFALAQGQLLAISQNTALFSLLGTTYGGDGRTTFALPDTRGRALIGAGNGPGLSSMQLGQRGGQETVTLTLGHLPQHNHTASTTVQLLSMDSSASTAVLKGLAATSNSNTPTGKVLANSPGRDNIYNDGAPNVELNPESIALNINLDMLFESTTTVDVAGGSQPLNVRDPYLAINWIIALQGIFPSRN